VLRPWSRDPGFYLDPLLRVAFTEIPTEPQRQKQLQMQLAQIPPLLLQARSNLDAVTADYADLALFSLENSDGVNHYHPYRAVLLPASSAGMRTCWAALSGPIRRS
jgi:hypothetical protein